MSVVVGLASTGGTAVPLLSDPSRTVNPKGAGAEWG